uniref:Cysteine synthase n=1 Tax=Magnetococcus massalia (strain MO-1) TaxID=451514 RepID=A0A1S7LEI8_MAGMO|nr:Cysteine synthase B [Candidatus Magnetococcus massalia]
MASLESLIGATPMVDLSRVVDAPPEVKLMAKLEGNNPGGSVKDRAALGMFMGAEMRGELNTETPIFEATSGNTGIALAMMAARRGYKLTLVMPETMTVERRAIMAAYGAEFILVSKEDGMEGAIDLVHEKVAAGEGICFDQFSNDDNWRAHYRTTGPEIWNDTGGRVSHFVSAMGTTGTIMGVSRALKEKSSAIKIIGVQPEEGSQIAGIRRWPEAYLPKIYDASRVDYVMDVTQQDAREMTRRLAREEGVFCGLSAGGAVMAAVRVAESLEESGTVVVILPDRGDRYLSTDLFM